jgi:predicted Zn-dependent protease
MDDTAMAAAMPACDWWSVRVVERRSLGLAVRNDVPEPVRAAHDVGAMVTVRSGGGEGYASTGALTPSGLAEAAGRALAWARRGAALGVVDARELARPSRASAWRAPAARPWTAAAPADLLATLADACRRLGRGAGIVDRGAGLQLVADAVRLVTADAVEVSRSADLVVPQLGATAYRAGESQTRSLGFDLARQGGLELLDAGAWDQAERLGDEALALLAAPDCPTGAMDLILLPSQMSLQIHESIGHPLELDRILGDERNYAGGSFVTPDMVGSYRYGSDLLTVTFDPEVPGEAASAAADDDGLAGGRVEIIARGILRRLLGGAASQRRSGLPGSASSRACSWNRPPIDRMANLNVEPGDATLARLVAGVEHGVLMCTNRSWSIDDRRDKFQFGCEWARVIRGGTLAELVRNPNYRGRSATFWRSLDGVGDRSTWQVHGVANCGKGEPNQVIQVGHAAPACRFREVAVFGGAA